jgi:DNA processing protein
MNHEANLLQYIRLTLLDKVGPVNARKLVAYCGGIEAVFHQDKNSLMKVPGIGENLAAHILAQDTLARAEEEMEFMEKEGIRGISYLDPEYPRRLQHCDDAPVILFIKGNVTLNTEKMISIVGTRKATEYGKHYIADFLKALKGHDPTIVSGLAYGVDICAHRESLNNGLPTIGVMAHGLDRIYPGGHRKTAHRMMEEGGLISEFVSGTAPDRERFPMRNRIVAGMSDATIVIESAARGGSMITAYLANGYNRDVFALPGRVGDEFSEGCNQLIRKDVAHLLDDIAEFERMMGWQHVKEKNSVQAKLFVDLTEEQSLLLGFLKEDPISIDVLTAESSLPMSKVSPLLLELEFKGLVRTLPGKRYMLI